MIRKPIVDGKFYPHTEETLTAMIESFMPKISSKISAKGIVLPHAGYTYSGKVAVTTVSKIIPRKRVVILGADHVGIAASAVLGEKGKWQIPLGQIPVDEELSEMILNSGDSVREDSYTHAQEHSIEAVLPVLGYFFGGFQFVPVICQVSHLDMYKKIAAQISKAVKKIKDDVLFVASTDMTHYEPDQTVRKKDRFALESIVNLDEEGLLRQVDRENITICGVGALVVLILCMKLIGVRKAQVSLYQTSGDSSGDYSSVVGYAGVIFN